MGRCALLMKNFVSPYFLCSLAETCQIKINLLTSHFHQQIKANIYDKCNEKRILFRLQGRLCNIIMKFGVMSVFIFIL